MPKYTKVNISIELNERIKSRASKCDLTIARLVDEALIKHLDHLDREELKTNAKKEWGIDDESDRLHRLSIKERFMNKSVSGFSNKPVVTQNVPKPNVVVDGRVYDPELGWCDVKSN